MSDWRPNTGMPAGSGDRWPLDYERGRPGYPPEAIDAAALAPGSTVVDLGAGTGKLTRLLVARFGRVVAIEPAEPMARVLAATTPDAELLRGSAEAIPLGDASVDAVFSAEAFHHFHGQRSVAEIARILRPGGSLVLLWNLPAGPTEPPIDAVETLVAERGLTRQRLGYEPLDLNAVKWEVGEWRQSLEDGPFDELREARFPHRQTLDREALVALIASMGWVGDLCEEERLPLLDRIRPLLTERSYARPWEAHVCWTRLRE